jgi:hypothetical protein
MRILPAIEFYGRRSQQLEALMQKGKKGEGPHILLDLAWSLAPFLTRHFPQLNDQGILDDVLATLQAMFGEDQ